MLGFWWLGCERLGWVSQGASGRGVRRVAEGQAGGSSGDVRVEAWILRAKTRGAVGDLRVEACEVGCWSVSGQTGGKAEKRLQCGADGQVLFICHDSQSISHQAVGHTSICLLSDSTADKQTEILYITYIT